jgi:hypothetical protein
MVGPSTLPRPPAQLIICLGPPECCRANDLVPVIERAIGQGADVWSFGCILLEAICWLVLGYDRLIRFRQQRRTETESEAIRHRHADIGCFHDGKAILNCVLQMYQEIRDNLDRRRDGWTGRLLRQVEFMLVPARDRGIALEFAIDIQGIFNGPPSPPLSPRDLFQPRAPYTSPRSRTQTLDYRPASDQTDPGSQSFPAVEDLRASANTRWFIPQAEAWQWYKDVKRAKEQGRLPPGSPFKDYLKGIGNRDVVSPNFLSVKSDSDTWRCSWSMMSNLCAPTGLMSTTR